MRSTHLASCVLAAGLVLAGCGGSETTTVSAPESIDEPAGTSTSTGKAESNDNASPDTTTDSTGESSTTSGSTSVSETAADEPTVSLDPAEAASQAEANADAIETTDDGRTTQILSIADGSITTLQQAVTGDRPVLLWFWAPH